MLRLGIALACLLPGPLAGDARAQQDKEERPLGTGSAFDLSRRPDQTVQIEAGTRLRKAPDAAAPAVGLIDVPVELPVSRRQGEWIRVLWGEIAGWVRPGPVDPVQWPEPLTPPPERPAPPPARPDPGVLDLALQLLGGQVPERSLGDLRLYTPITNERVLRRLDQIASGLPDAYETRFGLAPGEPSEEAVVLFPDEDSYMEFAGETTAAKIVTKGHAVGGVAALFHGGQKIEDLAPLVIHELTHLLNRRVFPREPPLWIEEGLANDLAFSRIEASGRLAFGTLSGSSFVANEGGGRRVWTLHLSGPRASLSSLLRSQRLRELESLPVLLDLTWGQFQDAERRSLNYAQSTFFVRFLLQAERGRYASGFHAFLVAAAAGNGTAGSDLAAHLETPLGQLERRFNRWLAGQSHLLR